MRKNYRQTLARIASLVSHGEITFDLLYAILVPGTVIVRRCPTTRETRAVLVRCSFGADGRTRGLAGAILSASVARVCFCRRWASQELQSCSRQACARRQRCDIEY